MIDTSELMEGGIALAEHGRLPARRQGHVPALLQQLTVVILDGSVDEGHRVIRTIRSYFLAAHPVQG